MTTRLATAGAVLVLAIIFGFIFWNQFASNQSNLAGGNPQVDNTSKKNDTVGAIETELNIMKFDDIDSDLNSFGTELNGF